MSWRDYDGSERELANQRRQQAAKNEEDAKQAEIARRLQEENSQKLEAARKRLLQNANDYEKNRYDFIKKINYRNFDADYSTYGQNLNSSDRKVLEEIHTLSKMVFDIQHSPSPVVNLNFQNLYLLEKSADLLRNIALESKTNFSLNLVELKNTENLVYIEKPLLTLFKNVPELHFTNSSITPEIATALIHLRQQAGMDFQPKSLRFSNVRGDINTLLQKMLLSADDKHSEIRVEKNSDDIVFSTNSSKVSHLAIKGIQSDLKDINTLLHLLPAKKLKWLSLTDNAFSEAIDIKDETIYRFDLSRNKILPSVAANLDTLFTKNLPGLEMLFLDNLIFNDEKIQTSLLKSLSAINTKKLVSVNLNFMRFTQHDADLLITFIDKNPQLQFIELAGFEHSPALIERLKTIISTTHPQLDITLSNPPADFKKLLLKNQTLLKLKSQYSGVMNYFISITSQKDFKNTDEKSNLDNKTKLYNDLVTVYESIPPLTHLDLADNETVINFINLRKVFEKQITEKLHEFQLKNQSKEIFDKNLLAAITAFQKAEPNNPASHAIIENYIHNLFTKSTQNIDTKSSPNEDRIFIFQKINTAIAVIRLLEPKNQNASYAQLIKKLLEILQLEVIERAIMLAEQNNLPELKSAGQTIIIQLFNSDELGKGFHIDAGYKIQLLARAILSQEQMDAKTLNLSHTAILNVIYSINVNQDLGGELSSSKGNKTALLLKLLQTIPASSTHYNQALIHKKNLVMLLINDTLKANKHSLETIVPQLAILIDANLTDKSRTEAQNLLVKSILPVEYAMPNAELNIEARFAQIQNLYLFLKNKFFGHALLNSDNQEICETAFLNLIKFCATHHKNMSAKMTENILTMLTTASLSAHNLNSLKTIANDLIKNQIFSAIAASKSISIDDVIKLKKQIGVRTDTFIKNIRITDSLEATQEQIRVYLEKYIINRSLQKTISRMIAPINVWIQKINPRETLIKKQPLDFNLQTAASMPTPSAPALNTAAAISPPPPSAPPQRQVIASVYNSLTGLRTPTVLSTTQPSKQSWQSQVDAKKSMHSLDSTTSLFQSVAAPSASAASATPNVIVVVVPEQPTTAASSSAKQEADLAAQVTALPVAAPATTDEKLKAAPIIRKPQII